MNNHQLLREAKRRVLRQYADKYAREYCQARFGVRAVSHYSDEYARLQAHYLCSQASGLDDRGLDQLLAVLPAETYLMALAATLSNMYIRLNEVESE